MIDKKTSRTFHYLLTFVSAAALIGCFLTHTIIGGTGAFMQLDSLAGSLVVGIVFAGYAVWFIVDESAEKKTDSRKVIFKPLSSCTAVFCIYAFWIVFILVPIAYYFF